MIDWTNWDVKFPKTWMKRRKTIHHKFMNDLVNTSECGPFDGGCVVVAEALQQVIGGEIVVLISPRTRQADHAAVSMGGMLWDYDGPLPPLPFMRRFEKHELLEYSYQKFRPISNGDLPEAYRDEELKHRLAAAFEQMLPEFQ